MRRVFGAEPTRKPAPPSPAFEPRKADALTVATFVLAIPSAFLAAVEMTERIDKRRRLRAMLEALRAHGAAADARITIVTPDGPRDLLSMSEDGLIALGDALTHRDQTPS